jgi:transcriptional regulator with XRE-family HTH domain
MSIATRLRQARKSRGYTQDSLAKTLGVSRGVIANIEYEKAEPQAIVIHAICECLQISKNWLLSGEGNMNVLPNSELRIQIISEINDAIKDLSDHELHFILDMLYTYLKHRNQL